MKRVCILSVLSVLLLLPACGTTKPPTKWRAWCNTESKDIGPWRDSKAAAEADRDAHLKMWGWHAVRIDAGN